MKKVILNLYNYGVKTTIANFGNNGHDAVKCMKFMNDEEVKAHGKLPESIFYYLTYTANKGRKCIYVDFTTGGLYPNDVEYMRKIDSMAECITA
jgi:hypothetical protein